MTVNEAGKFDVSVKGNLVNTNQRFLYLSCDECPYGTTANCGSLFMCRSCNVARTAIPRYRFVLNVFDDTGELEVTLFGREAERLIRMPAAEFHETVTQADYLPIDDINPRLQKLVFKMRIKSSLFVGINGTQTMRYNVQTLECYEEIPAEPVLPEPPRMIVLCHNLFKSLRQMMFLVPHRVSKNHTKF